MIKIAFRRTAVFFLAVVLVFSAMGISFGAEGDYNESEEEDEDLTDPPDQTMVGGGNDERDTQIDDISLSEDEQTRLLVSLTSAPTSGEPVELQSHSQETQDDLLDFVERTEGVDVVNTFWLTNVVSLSVDTDLFSPSTLLEIDHVERLFDPPEIEIMESPQVLSTGSDDDSPSSYSLYSDQDYTYGLEQINVPEAWDQYGTQGQGTSVAVLDTGVDVDHPDLEVEKWAHFDGAGDPVDSDPHDDNGHGTHVSGTVTGSEDPAGDVPAYGVAPEADLYGVKVLDGGSGTWEQIVAGMEWSVNEGADVMSMSLGASGYYDELMDPVVNSVAAGTTVVAAVGNDGEDTSSSPGNVYDAISVGASNEAEEIADFSSGENIETDDAWEDPPDHWPDEYIVPSVSAPGVDVLSSSAGGGYEEMDGTSMATPHVSGAIALVQSATAEDLEPEMIEDVLEETAFKPDGWDPPAGERDTRYGSGIIDVKEAIDYLGAEEAVEIYDWHDLYDIRDELEGYHILMNDLDENTDGYDDLVDTADGWNPIGNEADPFAGTFDGNGHTILDLYIDRPDEGRVGLFGYTEGSVIRNIDLVDIDITGEERVGGLVGYNDGLVTHSSASGSVEGADGWYNGVLVGFNYHDGEMTDSYSSGIVEGPGGLGGLSGINHGTIYDSYSTAEVIGTGNNIGGLVGELRGDIINSYSTGEVTGNDRVGGLVGRFASGSVEDSFWDTETSGQDTSAGDATGKTTEEMNDVATYTDTDTEGLDEPWDFVGDPNDDEGFEDIWSINENINDGYPFLTWQSFAIFDWYDLYAVRDDLDNNYVLMNDLDENSAGYDDLVDTNDGWEPIGNETGPFAGIFDGDGHMISDLYIDRPGTDSVGLFGHIDEEGVLSDLGVVDGHINGNEDVGVLVGTNDGTVENSYADVDVNAFAQVGGLIGSNQGTVSDSYATGDASGEDDHVGGLVGFNSDTIENSYSTGSVSGMSNVGGLLGGNTGTVSDSFWDVDTSGQDDSDGGTGKTTEEMHDVDTFTDTSTEGLDEPWDFVGDPNDDEGEEDIWGINENINYGYPFLTLHSSVIFDWYDLYAVREDLDNDHVLMNDLDENSAGYDDLVDTNDGWEPIGGNFDGFAGTFYGDGHMISDLYINRPGTDSVGLFGHIDDEGVITDLKVVDGYVNGNEDVGGLAGGNDGTVKSSYADVDVDGHTQVGGLIGINQGTVNRSYAAGDVSADYWDIGGLVGFNDGTVSNSYAAGDVTGEDNYVGGLVGWNPGTVENSYSTGFVSGESYVGGLIGSGTDTVYDSFWDVDTSGQDSSDGGTGKTTEEMKDVDTFTDTGTDGLEEPWDFIGNPNDDDGDEDIWDIDDDEVINDGYPFLNWEKGEVLEEIELTIGDEPGSVEIEDGETVSYEVTAYYLDDSSEYVTSDAVVTSVDDTKVSVQDADNTVTGESPGSTAVEAEYEGETDEVSVTVEEVLEEIELSIDSEGESVEIEYDETVSYEVTAYYSDDSSEDVTDDAVVTSDDDTIVSVNDVDNTVTGEEPGNTVVEAEYEDETDEVSVTVEEVLEEIELTIDSESESVEIDDGETVPYEVTAYYSDDSSEDVTDDAVVTSDDDTVVSVNDVDNTVTGEEPGNTVVEAEYQEETDEVSVTVEELEKYDLTVSIEEGDDGHEVTVEWNDEEYTVTDEETFEDIEGGTQVDLTADAAEDYFLDEWAGTDEEGDEITIPMDEDKEITAHFEEEEDPAYFEVEITNYEDEIQEGEETTVEYEVTNTGELEDTQNIIFYVDGEQEGVDLDITLDGEETHTDEFTWIAEEAGAYNLEITSDDDQDTVAVSVVEEEEDVEDEEDETIPGFTSILLVVAVITAVMIYKKKKG